METLPPISVDIVMGFWDYFSLGVAAFGAAAGAFAAYMAWRTVTSAERTLAAERQERRIAQALLVWGESLYGDKMPHSVVRNASTSPVSDVRIMRMYQGKRYVSLPVPIIPGGEDRKVSGWEESTVPVPDFAIEFRDAAGVRWRRNGMERPTEVPHLAVLPWHR